MKELLRLRHSSRALRAFVSCAAMFSASTAIFAADYAPTSTKHSLKISSASTRPATTARVAFFERNDPNRAAKLAQLETRRFPEQIDGWFVSMEAAALTQNEKTELISALAVCKLTKDGDPRSQIAAIRLENLGSNSETFRAQHRNIESLAASHAPCADAAANAMYEASLDGLANSDVRNFADRAGWLTKWTISRSGSFVVKPPAEQFEFADARIRIPDYLPSSALYSAEAEFVASEEREYAIRGDLAKTTISIDGKKVDASTVNLAVGSHSINVIFRAGEVMPRVRIVAASPRTESVWAQVQLPPRETAYLRAVISLANGKAAEAVDSLKRSELEGTAVGQSLLNPAAQTISSKGLRADGLGDLQSGFSHPSCSNLSSTLTAIATSDDRTQASSIAEQLQACAPDSLMYARWLIAANRHAEAVNELRRVVREWPLDREAHRMLIAELQRGGNNLDADRAAAEFLSIAPNARIFRRMARNAAVAIETESATPFYEAYRRPAPAAITADTHPDAGAVILLQDKVAITRLDGSVSMYMHRVVQLLTSSGAEEFQPLAIPDGGQLLSARVVNRSISLAPVAVRAGDEIEEEYVVHYTGDGGMISHPEAFQYVFNDFDNPLLQARFVVITPSTQTPGYVIASGDVPPSHTEVSGGFRAQVWEKTIETADLANAMPAIVRVVENENGWSIPPSVERRRILETIHPGPRPREATLRLPDFPALLN